MNKIIWCAIVGGVIILLASVHGCGSVDLNGLDAGAAGAAAGGDAGTAGAPDGSARGGHVGATGGASGGSDGGVAGGVGGTPDGGAAGAPGRPLGAGCSDDNQCGSHICTTVAGSTGMCCDGQTNECSTCVGGYVTPYTDGRSCGQGDICDGSDHHQYRCVAGACTARPVIHCALAVCDKTGKPLGCPSPGGCKLPDDDPCYCYIGGGMGSISYPCP